VSLNEVAQGCWQLAVIHASVRGRPPVNRATESALSQAAPPRSQDACQ